MVRTMTQYSRSIAALIIALMVTGVAVSPVFFLKPPIPIQSNGGSGTTSVVTSADFVPVQLTTGKSNDTDPVLSPDSQLIAFSSNRLSRTDQIWIMDSADGSHMTRLTSMRGNATDPQWSPDGLKIAFTESIGKSWELWVIDLNGTNLRNLTGLESFPSSFNWSPKDDVIVYCDASNGSSEIVGTDATSFKDVFEIDCPQGSQCYDPSFSSDGIKVVFVAKTESQSNLIINNIRNGSLGIALTIPSNEAVLVRFPAFSIDDKNLYFLEQEIFASSSPQSSIWGVFVMTLGVSGNASLRNILTPPPSETYAQSWQPTLSSYSLFGLKPDNASDILVSGSTSPGTEDLYLIDENSLIEEFAGGGFTLTAPGISIQRFTSLKYDAITGLEWSSDGSMIVYSAANLGSAQSHVYIMRYVEVVQVNPYG